MEPDSDDPPGEPQADLELPRAEFLWRRLRLALIEARTEQGLSQKQVATELGWSISKVSRIEQGPASVSPSDVRAMLSLFRADHETIQSHVDLAHEARSSRSWTDFNDVLSKEYMNYIGQEQSATHIFKYETGLIPGLLQTREFSLALFREMGVADGAARRLGEVRQLRQSILDEDTGPELTIVVGEIALVRVVGSPGIMRQQIEHMVSLSDHDRVSLFLMPFTAGAHPGLGVPFTILEFRDQQVKSALFLEDGLKQTTSFDDPELVEKQFALFETLESKAEQTGTFKKHAERILAQYYSGET